MQNTTNYLLKKPELTDYVNVGDLNENADIIDAELKRQDDELVAHKADDTHFLKRNGDPEIGDAIIYAKDEIMSDYPLRVMLDNNIFGVPIQILPVFTPFYTEGVETIPFVAGYKVGTNSVSKEVDHLYLEAKSTSAVNTAEATYVSDTMVDLTNVDGIVMEFEQIGTEDGSNISTLAVGTVKTAKYSSASAKASYYHAPATLGRQTLQVDVSTLSGSYYIRVHATMTSSVTKYNKLKVYSIKLKTIPVVI